jgi:hypothetical protein
MLPGAGQQVGIAAAEGLLAAMVIDHELAFGPLDTDALSHA